MKVRIGISLGPAGTPEAFADAVDLLEQAGVDSLWLPENVYSPLVEPFTGMAFALSRTRRLKAGSGISVLPGRHPVLVAKQLASLAGLAPGRVLPVFGLLPAQPAERVLFPRARRQARRGVRRVAATASAAAHRGEGLVRRGVLHRVRRQRRLAAGQAARHLAGRFGPRGAAPGGTAGRRVARLAADARRGRRRGRRDPGSRGRGPAGRSSPITSASACRWRCRKCAGNEHGIPPALLASIHRRRPEADPATLVAAGWDGARRMIGQYVEAGLSKFVVRPASPRARSVRSSTASCASSCHYRIDYRTGGCLRCIR